MSDRISIRSDVCHGKPVIRDTRVMVQTIVGAIRAGDSIEMIQEDYNISREEIEESITWSQKYLRSPEEMKHLMSQTREAIQIMRKKFFPNLEVI